MLYSQALLDQQEKPYGESLKLVLSVEVVSLNQFLKTFDGYKVILKNNDLLSACCALILLIPLHEFSNFILTVDYFIPIGQKTEVHGC